MKKSTNSLEARRPINRLAIVGTLSLFTMIASQVSASAQGLSSQPAGAVPLPNQVINWVPANQAPVQGAPPPIGSGPSAPPEITGDTGSAPPPTSGTADSTTGDRLSTEPNAPIKHKNATTVYVYVPTFARSNGTTPDGLPDTGANQGNPPNRGLRLVMTIRPNTLTNDQISSINGILGINMQSGKEVIPVTTTDNNVELINTVLYPGASQQEWGIAQMENGVFPNGRLKINQDPNPNGGVGSVANVGNLYISPQTSPLQKFWDQGFYYTVPVLPYVFVMCRWLIIAGVVFATVKISLASYAMVMGHPYAGSRAIAAVSGLMMLLAAFTIYKIVRMNAGSTGPAPQVINLSKTGGIGTLPSCTPNVPIVPISANGRPVRSGVPVAPLSAN